MLINIISDSGPHLSTPSHILKRDRDKTSEEENSNSVSYYFLCGLLSVIQSTVQLDARVAIPLASSHSLACGKHSPFQSFSALLPKQFRIYASQHRWRKLHFLGVSSYCVAVLYYSVCRVLPFIRWNSFPKSPTGYVVAAQSFGPFSPFPFRSIHYLHSCLADWLPRAASRHRAYFRRRIAVDWRGWISAIAAPNSWHPRQPELWEAVSSKSW